jgi:hypothetical protein
MGGRMTSRGRIVEIFLISFALLGLLGSQAGCQRYPDSIESEFQKANKAMLESRHPDAIASYERCFEAHSSGALHHNLGLAHYLDGNLGLAVYHLESALRLQLQSVDTQEVLSIIRKVEGLQEPKLKMFQAFSKTLPEWIWMYLALGSFWGVVIFGFGGRRLLGMGTVSRDLAIGLTLVFGVALAGCFGLNEDSRVGVLVSARNAVLLIPEPDGETIVELKAGELARELRTRKGFVFVETRDRIRGWVAVNDFRLIR